MGEAPRVSAERHADERAGDVDPVVGEVAHGDVGTQGACRVHRGARDRAHQHHLDAHHRAHRHAREGAVRALVEADARDHPHQQEREEELDEEGRERRDADGRIGQVGAHGAEVAERPVEAHPRQHRARELRQRVAGDEAPLEMADQRRRNGERRVDVGARDVTEGVDDDGDDQARDQAGADGAERAAHLGVDDNGARGEEDEREGADELAAVAAQLVGPCRRREPQTWPGSFLHPTGE